MQEKRKRAVIYSICGFFIILLLVITVSVLQRNPEQARLNSLFTNTEKVVHAIEATNMTSLAFDERTWAATALHGLRSDIEHLKNHDAKNATEALESEDETLTPKELFDLSISLLEENVSLYHQLEASRQNSLQRVLKNQQLLLEEARTLR